MAKEVDGSMGKWTRRRFLQQMGTAAVAGPLVLPRFAKAEKKHRLSILQWNHFVPAFDQWFDQKFVKEWGDANDAEVIVDRVGMTSLVSRAHAEVNAGKGHDLFMFLRPPPVFEDYVIDHAEIYAECERLYGKPNDIALRSTYNPKTGKYYGFADSYVPDPVNYRKDLWEDIGMFPDTWDDIRVGGAKIYKKHRVPLGMGMAPELDSNMALRSLLSAFGASVQTADGKPALSSKQTLEALKFAKALYREAMTEEVFTWDPSSNNRMLLAGHGSLALNAISITRTGEAQKIPIADRIWLAKAAQGPVRRIALIHLMHVYVIWKFSPQTELAKRFLVDYVGRFRDAFLASRFYNFPCFPKTVPDASRLIAHDVQANPSDKYKILEDVDQWTTAVGYPGYSNAAIDEIFNKWVISRMFAEAARGRMTPEQAMKAADQQVRGIFDKWRTAGKV